jgi:hypothetical protein
MKQDEEMMMLKDMVKSTALQIKVKDGLDKLSELSSKFKIQQMRGRFIERGIQTGGGGAKHAQTQCTPAVTKKDFGAQSDGVKFMDK